MTVTVSAMSVPVHDAVSHGGHRWVTVGAPGADRFWGPRDCGVRDPSGTLVRIAQA